MINIINPLIDTTSLKVICVHVDFNFLFEIIEEAGFIIFSENELLNWLEIEKDEIFIKNLVQHFADALNAKLSNDNSTYHLEFADQWNQRFHIKQGIINPQYVLTFEYDPNTISSIYKPDSEGLTDKLITALGEYEFNLAFKKILNGEAKTLAEAGIRINVYTNMSGCSFWIKVSLINENVGEVLKAYQEHKEKLDALRELEFMEDLLKNIGDDEDYECTIGDDDEEE